MKVIFLTIVLLLSTQVLAADTVEQTIGQHRVISKAIKEKFQPEMAAEILTAVYDGFYQISGKQKSGDLFKFTRVKEKASFPDNRWQDVALKLTEGLAYESSSNNLGTRGKAKATAYVVFYKNGIDSINKKRGNSGSLTLVMIEQKNAGSKNTNSPSLKGISASRVYLLNAGI